MMCQRIGWPPISTIGFGFSSVSSERRVPRPPARITTLSALPEGALGAFGTCRVSQDVGGGADGRDGWAVVDRVGEPSLGSGIWKGVSLRIRTFLMRLPISASPRITVVPRLMVTPTFCEGP